jgi:hypothetical protein
MISCASYAQGKEIGGISHCGTINMSYIIAELAAIKMWI